MTNQTNAAKVSDSVKSGYEVEERLLREQESRWKAMDLEVDGIRKGYVEGMLSSAVRTGYADAMAGKPRKYEIVKGHDLRGSGERTWQIKDSLGNVRDIEHRSLFQIRPPQLTRLVLMASEMGHAGGVDEATEDLARGAKNEETAPLAPGM